MAPFAWRQSVNLDGTGEDAPSVDILRETTLHSACYVGRIALLKM